MIIPIEKRVDQYYDMSQYEKLDFSYGGLRGNALAITITVKLYETDLASSLISVWAAPGADGLASQYQTSCYSMINIGPNTRSF